MLGWAHVSAITDSEMKIQVQIDSDLKDNRKDHEQRLRLLEKQLAKLSAMKSGTTTYGSRILKCFPGYKKSAHDTVQALSQCGNLWLRNAAMGQQLPRRP